MSSLTLKPTLYFITKIPLEQLISLILDSGRTALDMALYVMLPIMVVMLAVMKLLDAKGILSWTANKLAPFSRVFGIPGLGIFAMIKLLLVGFAAPIATLALMNKGGTSRRYLASTLAVLFTMSQANASYPLATVGLNLGVAMLTSVLGGLAAGAFTYYVLCRNFDNNSPIESTVQGTSPEEEKKTVMQILTDGGQEGMKIVFNMLPVLILALFFVNALEAMGVIALISPILATPLALIGLPEATVLPIITKFLAGGTAFMGVTIDLVNQGIISPLELNRMAGFTINSFDIIGISIFASVGKKISGVIRYSLYGAVFGIVIRGIAHLIIF